MRNRAMKWSSVRPSVRPSDQSIDSSSVTRRVCCRSPCGHQISSDSSNGAAARRSVAKAGSVVLTAAARGWTQTCLSLLGYWRKATSALPGVIWWTSKGWGQWAIFRDCKCMCGFMNNIYHRSTVLVIVATIDNNMLNLTDSLCIYTIMWSKRPTVFVSY